MDLKRSCTKRVIRKQEFREIVSPSSWSQKPWNQSSVRSNNFWSSTLEFQASLHFLPNKQIIRECRLYTDKYDEDLLLSSLFMYGQTIFIPKTMKEYSHAAITLRAYSQGFEVADFFLKSFSISVLENLANGNEANYIWRNI